ncbi:unnamed protein product, partial [Brenthis ino]
MEVQCDDKNRLGLPLYVLVFRVKDALPRGVSPVYFEWPSVINHLSHTEYIAEDVRSEGEPACCILVLVWWSSNFCKLIRFEVNDLLRMILFCL